MLPSCSIEHCTWHRSMASTSRGEPRCTAVRIASFTHAMNSPLRADSEPAAAAAASSSAGVHSTASTMKATPHRGSSHRGPHDAAVWKPVWRAFSRAAAAPCSARARWPTDRPCGGGAVSHAARTRDAPLANAVTHSSGRGVALQPLPEGLEVRAVPRGQVVDEEARSPPPRAQRPGWHVSATERVKEREGRGGHTRRGRRPGPRPPSARGTRSSRGQQGWPCAGGPPLRLLPRHWQPLPRPRRTARGRRTRTRAGPPLPVRPGRRTPRGQAPGTAPAGASQ